jgi:hypothetical protein
MSAASAEQQGQGALHLVEIGPVSGGCDGAAHAGTRPDRVHRDERDLDSGGLSVIDGNQGSTAQVTTHRAFESGWNLAQFGIQALFALAILCGLLGVFGSGWLAETTTRAADLPITVSYDRFLRNSAPAQIQLAISAPVPHERVAVRLNRDYLDRVSVSQTEPRAAAVQADADGATYLFDLGPDKRGEITFSLKPQDFGILHAGWSVLGRSVSFTQLVYP